MGVSVIVSSIIVLVAAGATIRLAIGISSGENVSGLTVQYALAMAYTAIYAILASVFAVIQTVGKLIGG